MKKEYWKYVSITLSVATVVLLVYGTLGSGGNGINMTGAVDTTDYISDAETVGTNHIFEKDISGSVTTRIIPMDAMFTGGELYAEQTIVNRIAVITRGMWWGQNFGFGGETNSIVAFHLAIGRVGNPEYPVVLGLSSLVDNTVWYRVAEFPASAFPEEGLYWVEVFFEDEPFETTGMVLASASNQLVGNYPNDYWAIGFSQGGNPYELGVFVTTDPGEDTVWTCIDVDDDAAFRVYVSGTPDDPPVVYIAIDAYIQTTGFITLIGAALSSIKYGVLVGWL